MKLRGTYGQLHDYEDESWIIQEVLFRIKEISKELGLKYSIHRRSGPTKAWERTHISIVLPTKEELVEWNHCPEDEEKEEDK